MTHPCKACMCTTCDIGINDVIRQALGRCCVWLVGRIYGIADSRTPLLLLLLLLMGFGIGQSLQLT